MPILGTLLVSLFTGLAEFFALWMAKRIALSAAAISAFVVLLGTLASVISGLAAGVIAAMPSDSYLATGLYLALPSNAAACMAVWLAVDAACGAYKFGFVTLKFSAAV